MIITCPLCKKRTTWEENPWRPFCSERCKLMDLGKWASEEYRIESEEKEEEGDDKRENETADNGRGRPDGTRAKDSP